MSFTLPSACEMSSSGRFIRFLTSRDLAINLRGAAGTGKTATLQEIDRGLHDAGREVVAVAPTRSAVEELRKVGLPRCDDDLAITGG